MHGDFFGQILVKKAPQIEGALARLAVKVFFRGFPGFFL
jgi:hypothetical protein